MSPARNENPIRDENFEDKETSNPATSTSQLEGYDMPSLPSMVAQLLVLCLAILLHYLRKQGTPLLLGWKVGLVWGIVPIECLIFCGLLGELAMRELGFLQRCMEMITAGDV